MLAVRLRNDRRWQRRWGKHVPPTAAHATRQRTGSGKSERGHSAPSDLERRPAHLRRPQQRHRRLYPSASRASVRNAGASQDGDCPSPDIHADPLQPTRPLLLTRSDPPEHMQTHQRHRRSLRTSSLMFVGEPEDGHVQGAAQERVVSKAGRRRNARTPNGRRSRVSHGGSGSLVHVSKVRT